MWANALSRLTAAAAAAALRYHNATRRAALSLSFVRPSVTAYSEIPSEAHAGLRWEMSDASMIWPDPIGGGPVGDLKTSCYTLTLMSACSVVWHMQWFMVR